MSSVIYKANGPGPIEDLMIEATVAVPDVQTGDARGFFDRQARDIFRLLVRSLPGGTIDALTVCLLDHAR